VKERSELGGNMPSWERVSHVSFSVRDMDRCADWFVEVLGFALLDQGGG
jgi:catechol 2,3-dioxygenase-like lactoylglutathione lyase family enzyme